MVVQRTLNNLRERPKDERVAVAGGIAIAVVAVLLIGWAVLFLHGIGGASSVQASDQNIPAAPSSTLPTPVVSNSTQTTIDQESQYPTGTPDQSNTPASPSVVPSDTAPSDAAPSASPTSSY